MTDLLQDIETIKDVLVAWEEGASDEKRMAREQLRNMLQRKMCEAEMERQADMFDNVPV